MKIIGLTGGIGSGKTMVARIFEQFGIPVFYADDEAKALYKDKNVLNKLCKIAGENVLDEAGLLDKEKFSRIIFGNKEILQQVNAYVHPLVRQRFAEWMQEREGTAPYCVREAAILIESGAHTDCDKIIVVTASEELRVQWVMERDNAAAEDIRRRMKVQMSDAEKIKFADFVIYNDLSDSLIRQVLHIHQILSA